jgi:competence protein ComEA
MKMEKVDEAAELAALLRRKRMLMAVVALGIISACLYGWWQRVQPPPGAILPPQSEKVEAASRKAGTEVVVYVSGMVKSPGLLKISAGSRVLDAVNAAGGLLPGAEVGKVNLAQPVKDGLHIHVPGVTVQKGTTSTVGNCDTNPAYQKEKININTADTVLLDQLPGVGPALAARIVEYRLTKGPFHDGSDLKKVAGVSEIKYQKIKDKIVW